MSRGRGEDGYGAEFLRGVAGGLASLSDRIIAWQEAVERRAVEAEAKAIAERELQARKTEEARIASEKMWAERRAEEVALAKLKEEGVGWGQRLLIRVRKRLLTPLREWKERNDQHYERFLALQSQLAVDANGEKQAPWQARSGAEDAWSESLSALVNEQAPFDWQQELSVPEEKSREQVEETVLSSAANVTTAVQQEEALASASEIMEQEAVAVAAEQIITEAESSANEIADDTVSGVTEVADDTTEESSRESDNSTDDPTEPDSRLEEVAAAIENTPAIVENKLAEELDTDESSAPEEEAPVEAELTTDVENTEDTPEEAAVPAGEPAEATEEEPATEEALKSEPESEPIEEPEEIIAPKTESQPVLTETEDNGAAIPSWAQGISWDEAIAEQTKLEQDTAGEEAVEKANNEVVEKPLPQPKKSSTSKKKTTAKSTKKKQPQSHPKGFWNWDVDDAASAKQLADLTPDERAAAQKAFAEKKQKTSEAKVAEDIDADKKPASAPKKKSTKTTSSKKRAATTKKTATKKSSKSEQKAKPATSKNDKAATAKKTASKSSSKAKAQAEKKAVKKTAPKSSGKAKAPAEKKAAKKTAPKSSGKTKVPAEKKAAKQVSSKSEPKKSPSKKVSASKKTATQSPIAKATTALIDAGWSEADARKGGYVQYHWQQVKGAPNFDDDELKKMVKYEEWVAKYVKELTAGTQTKPHYTRHMEESGSMVFKINNLALVRVDKEFKVHQLVTKAAARLLI